MRWHHDGTLTRRSISGRTGEPGDVDETIPHRLSHELYVVLENVIGGEEPKESAATVSSAVGVLQ